MHLSAHDFRYLSYNTTADLYEFDAYFIINSNSRLELSKNLDTCSMDSFIPASHAR